MPIVTRVVVLHNTGSEYTKSSTHKRTFDVSNYMDKQGSHTGGIIVVTAKNVIYSFPYKNKMYTKHSSLSRVIKTPTQI